MSGTEQHRVQSTVEHCIRFLWEVVGAVWPGHLCAAEWSGQGLCQVAAILSCTSSALHPSHSAAHTLTTQHMQ